ncbi:hypothetical protein Tco_1283859 [Tanacetum coccineum]
MDHIARSSDPDDIRHFLNWTVSNGETYHKSQRSLHPTSILTNDLKPRHELAMPSYFHKKFRWGTVFATRRRSFIESGTGLRMKRTNHRTRVPIGLYPCHIEENMTIKEVRGESVMDSKTKVTTKEGIVIKFPGKFCRYKLATEEEVEENQGLKEVWE